MCVYTVHAHVDGYCLFFHYVLLALVYNILCVVVDLISCTCRWLLVYFFLLCVCLFVYHRSRPGRQREQQQEEEEEEERDVVKGDQSYDSDQSTDEERQHEDNTQRGE